MTTPNNPTNPENPANGETPDLAPLAQDLIKREAPDDELHAHQLIDQVPPLPRAQKMLVERQGLHASGMRGGELGADDGQRRIALLAASRPIPQAP